MLGLDMDLERMLLYIHHRDGDPQNFRLMGFRCRFDTEHHLKRSNVPLQSWIVC